MEKHEFLGRFIRASGLQGMSCPVNSLSQPGFSDSWLDAHPIPHSLPPITLLPIHPFTSCAALHGRIFSSTFVVFPLARSAPVYIHARHPSVSLVPSIALQHHIVFHPTHTYSLFAFQSLPVIVATGTRQLLRCSRRVDNSKASSHHG